MDKYDEAVQTAAAADRTIRWVQPVKAFGYVVLGISTIAALLGVVELFLSLFQEALFGYPVIALALLLFGLIGFLQASAVLMVASYVQMKSQEVAYRVTDFLSPDET